MIDSLPTGLKSLLGRHNVQEDYKELFNSERGQRVLRHMCIQAGITRPSLTTDTNSLLVKEGRQQFVYSVLKNVLGSEDALAKFIINQLQEQEIKPNENAPRSAV